MALAIGSSRQGGYLPLEVYPADGVVVDVGENDRVCVQASQADGLKEAGPGTVRQQSRIRQPNFQSTD